MKSRAGLIALTVVLLGAGCGEKSSSNREATGTTLSGYGMMVSLPSGWAGRVYQLSPQHAITLQASTVPLPARGADQARIAARMKATDSYVVIDDIGPPPPGLGREPVWELEPKLPLKISDSDIEGPWKGGFPSGAALAVVVNDRALMIRVFFGSHPNEEEVDAVNALLATLSVAPRPA